MSLLDDVSIVVTPNGYKAGELYAVIPVPSEGAELVTDGSFPTGTTAWSEGTGWSLVDGYANASSASGELSQSGIDFDTSKRYYIQYTISGYSGSGGIQTRFKGAVWNTGELREENGTFTEVLMSTAENNVFSFVTSSSFTGSISNVSVKEYTSADMDVTRATAATRVDENGLVNYAEVLGDELVTDGDFPLPNVNWTFGVDWEILNGTANYTSGTTNSLYQSALTLTSGITYNIRFSISNAIGNAEFWTGNSSGSVNYISGGYVNYANGDYNLYFTMPSSQTSLAFYARNVSFSIDNISVKQVDRDNVPRIDYAGGGCPHILAEPMRTNLIPYSEDFSESAWAKTRCTIDSGGHISPSGESNAFKMTATDDDARLQDGSAAAGIVYTQSIYVKSATGSDVSGQIDFTGADIQTFTATSEWQRVDTTLTNMVKSGLVRVRITNSGDELYVWGAQVEVGSYATSYIPNFGTALGVTRNQDIFTRDGIGSLINSTEGVLFLEMAALSDDGTNRGVSLNDGTSSSRLLLYFSSASNQIAVISSGFAGSITYTLPDETSFNKIAVRYKANDITLWVDGASRGTPITSATIPTFTAFKFDSGSGSSPFFGKVKQLQVYDTALTDEQLLQLTGESGTDFYESYAEMASALTYTIQ